jgi:hypothetical protein
MFRRVIEVLNGKWIEDVINNFDPYGIKEQTDIELNKKHHEKTKLNNKEKIK